MCAETAQKPVGYGLEQASLQSKRDGQDDHDSSACRDGVAQNGVIESHDEELASERQDDCQCEDRQRRRPCRAHPAAQWKPEPFRVFRNKPRHEIRRSQEADNAPKVQSVLIETEIHGRQPVGPSVVECLKGDRQQHAGAESHEKRAANIENAPGFA